MAMDRLEKDENSWHRQFGDLPVFEDGDAVKSNPGETGHLTQNLDLSNMSGIIAGDITVKYDTFFKVIQVVCFITLFMICFILSQLQYDGRCWEAQTFSRRVF